MLQKYALFSHISFTLNYHHQVHVYHGISVSSIGIRAVAGQRARLLLTFVKHKAKPDQYTGCYLRPDIKRFCLTFTIGPDRIWFCLIQVQDFFLQ